MIAKLGGNEELGNGPHVNLLATTQTTPSPPVQTLAQAHSAEVWVALLGSLTIIGSLLVLLYKRINSDIKDVCNDVEEAFDGIGKCREKIAAIETNMAQFATHNVLASKLVDDIEAELKALSDRMLVVETEHKRCYAAYLKSRGE